MSQSCSDGREMYKKSETRAKLLFLLLNQLLSLTFLLPSPSSDLKAFSYFNICALAEPVGPGRLTCVLTRNPSLFRRKARLLVTQYRGLYVAA